MKFNKLVKSSMNRQGQVEQTITGIEKKRNCTHTAIKKKILATIFKSSNTINRPNLQIPDVEKGS